MAIPETKDDHKERCLPRLPRGNQIAAFMFGLRAGALQVSAAAASDGWLCPWHDLGLGQVPDPLVGHEVQEKDLQELCSRLRQGQTHRCSEQTRMKAREIVHKSNGFTFPLSPPNAGFLINPETYRSNSETNFRKKSENENFRPDFFSPGHS